MATKEGQAALAKTLKLPGDPSKDQCPFCGKLVSFDDFRDDLSRKEYQISGLCQKCQDGFFHEPDSVPDEALDIAEKN